MRDLGPPDSSMNLSCHTGRRDAKKLHLNKPPSQLNCLLYCNLLMDGMNQQQHQPWTVQVMVASFISAHRASFA
ncbi:Uncharacterized protein HZ326_16405 [Fusarium oxysporum f. sp. albedinis]|nr:Uncharacterized protein HZ326_16405 [Fusarium oxysporum f. sp. albedinis]